jgi:hypothetical protein
MRRDLTIRCLSTGTIRTEGPAGARWELREIRLELDGAPVRVQILEGDDRGQHTRDCTIDLEGISVRTRTGHDVREPTSISHTLLDWLLQIAEWMRKGERRTVSLWVRSTEPAALLNATPVTAGSSRRSDPTDEAKERGAIDLLEPSPRLRLIAAGS